jgi:spermidine/putrescine transport system permease protein
MASSLPQTNALRKSATLDRWIRTLGGRSLWLITALGFAFIYIPIFILVIYSFNLSRTSGLWTGFTTNWYASLWQGATNQSPDLSTTLIWDALRNSLIVGSISTFFATTLGTMLAIALERFKFRGKALLEALVFLPIIIPEITMGISLLLFFSLAFQLIQNLTGIRLVLGLPTVIIGHITFNISFVVVTVRARLGEIDPCLEEAALDLGANEWKTLQRVILPLIAPSIFSAGLLAFTLSLDDFVITFFTNGVGSTTLPVFVYGMIRLSITPAINAISTLMLIASLGLVISSMSLQQTTSRK